MRLRDPLNGFTLAELLIALAILGEIATFTIPKILSSQQSAQKKAVAKEAAAMIAGAYQQAQLNGTITTSTTMGNITQYMNYVSVDTTSSIDTYPGNAASTASCGATSCIRLHNGALFFNSPVPFGTTSGVIYGIIDPDGIVTSQQDSIVFAQYYNGRLTTYGTQYGASYDPTWFSW